MTASICTLFEGDYHYGFGALVNSLFTHGFRGTIWAGYRGALPPWATQVTEHFPYSEFRVGDGCRVCFLRLGTKAHFTNFKADFMLSVIDEYEPECESVFYLDPDIVVCEPWRSFEEWISCGVAVCEDVNSPISLYDPHRIGWRRFYNDIGIALHPRESCYANGGCIGVSRENREFLVTWKRLQDALLAAIGGADVAGVPGGKSNAGRTGFFGCFGQPDQDALNAAIEAAVEIPVSFLGRHAMAFQSGKPYLPHAVGRLKPWRNRILSNALRGFGCPFADRHFWKSVERPIRLYSKFTVVLRRFQLRVAAAMGRFYRLS